MIIHRPTEVEILNRFLKKSGSGFLHVRGRRRVGKTWLLTEFAKKQEAFFFQGEEDADTKSLQKTFAELWSKYSNDETLSYIRKDNLSWDLLFEKVTFYANSQRPHKVILIFDEIQWLAKKNSGFISKLKKFWVAWEQSNNVKILICGSSNKFFSDNTGGDVKILRGLRTHSDLWVEPFTLAEVKKHYFKSWNYEEVCLIYMLLGGIPYYLEKVPQIKNPIHAINEALFTKGSIFLNEIDEIIELEFARSSKKNVHQVLSALGQTGKTVTSVAHLTGLSLSTVSDIIKKLSDYQLVFPKTPFQEKKKDSAQGVKYYMRDFFLNSYYNLLRPIENEIRHNSNKNIFAEKYLRSKSGFYIENYSGHAFELLIEHLLRSQLLGGHNSSLLFKKLNIKTLNCEIGHHWEANVAEVDLICYAPTERQVVLIEAKWISKSSSISMDNIENVLSKNILFSIRNYLQYALILSQKPSQAFYKKAAEKEVEVLSLEDLFEY